MTLEDLSMKYNPKDSYTNYVDVLEKIINGGFHHTTLSLEEQLVLNEGNFNGGYNFQGLGPMHDRKVFFLSRIIQIRIQLIKKKYC